MSVHTKEKRYEATRVKSWRNLQERGFAFFVASTGEEVWFHFTSLPKEIRYWFRRDSSQRRLLPVVSFIISFTEKGPAAADIRLEPSWERETIWYKGGQSIWLRSGKSIELWPELKTPLEEGEFWTCQIHSILPGCLDANGIDCLARPGQKFVLGRDKAPGTIEQEAIAQLEKDLLEKFGQISSSRADGAALSWLCDRLEGLSYSFGWELKPEIQKQLLAFVEQRYSGAELEEVGDRLGAYLPEIVLPIWKKKALELPMVALDIESDGRQIWQLAIVGQQGAIVSLKKPRDEEVRQQLAKLESGQTLVGHKILDWDLDILRRKGCEVDKFHICDTLKEEMLLDPLRSCYALDTAHKALADAEKTLELARNQYLRRSESPVVREIAQKESDAFFLRGQTPTWMERIEPLLHGKCKTLIVGPSEYAATLMRPPVAQVIQPTATPISFVNDAEQKEGEKLFERYTEEVKKLGYAPIAELAPIILQKQWELGGEKTVPDIPSKVRIVYCSFGDYGRADIREKIGAWGPQESHLFFPEMMAFDSRRRIREISEKEYEEQIEQKGLWTRFAVGRSYVSLELLGLPKSAFTSKEEPAANGLTRFWLEKTIKGKIELWGCVDEKKFTTSYEDARNLKRHALEDKIPAAWRLPVSYRRETLREDIRLAPETRFRSDYWQNILPIIFHYCQDSEKIILAANEIEEIPKLEEGISQISQKVTSGLRILAIAPKDNGSLRQKIRKFAKLQHALLIVPMLQIERTIRELQSISADIISNDITIILESLPVNLVPALGAVEPDWVSPKSSIESGEGYEQNPDGELESDEEEDQETSDNDEIKFDSGEAGQKISRIRLADKVSACIPVLAKIALWLAEGSSTRLVCLDPRLKAVSSKTGEDRELLKMERLRELPELPKIDLDFRQPGEFVLPEENIWRETIEKAFIPGFSPDVSLSDEQVGHLKAILPRELDNRFISMPTGGGKSIVFQAPALYRGYSTGRLTIVVSPLKALIKDQERSLWQKGFINTVDGLTGDMTRPEIEDCYRRISGGESLLVYVAPERFRNRLFREVLEERFNRDESGPEFWVFDEAHCLSLWGLDFRPDYFYAAKFIVKQRKKGRDAPILLLSATMSNQVKKDLENTLEINIQSV